MGKYSKALKINQKVYALRCEHLGEQHSETLKIAERIKELQEKI